MSSFCQHFLQIVLLSSFNSHITAKFGYCKLSLHSATFSLNQLTSLICILCQIICIFICISATFSLNSVYTVQHSVYCKFSLHGITFSLNFIWLHSATISKEYLVHPLTHHLHLHSVDLHLDWWSVGSQSSSSCGGARSGLDRGRPGARPKAEDHYSMSSVARWHARAWLEASCCEEAELRSLDLNFGGCGLGTIWNLEGVDVKLTLCRSFCLLDKTFSGRRGKVVLIRHN